MRFIIFLLASIVLLGLYIPGLAQSGDPPAQDPLVLTDEQGEYSLGRYLDILEDPTGELTIEDVTSPEYDSQFVRSQVAVPNYGFTDSAYWLRLRLRNKTNLTNQWLLEVNFPNLNYVDLYTSAKGGGFIKKESGGLREFDTRDIPFYHVVFKQPVAIQDDQTIYLRVESGGAMTLAFTLWSPEAFAVGKSLDMLWIGLFYGSLLIVLGYHLLLFISTKEAIYFYFILVLASAILFFATYEGVADQFLWPGLSQEKLFFLVITMSLFFISLLMFSDVFLEQSTRAPIIHQLFYLFIGAWAMMIVIMPFFSFEFMANLASILFILTPGFAILAGIYSWRKRYQQALFYLISWLGFLLGILTLDLVRIGILPSNVVTEKSYQLGIIWLVLLWSLALADRINLLKAQTEIANLALRNSENRLSQILEGLPLGVVVYGKDQKPTYLNQRTVEILSNPARGIQPDTSARRTLSQAIDYYSFRIAGSDQAYPLENLPVARAFEGEMASVDDIEADLLDKRVTLEIWANPIKDEYGEVDTAVVAFQDITSRKQAEAELIEYRFHLEKLVEQRTAELSLINDQLNQEVAERKLLEAILQKRIEWLSAVNRVHQSISGKVDLPDAFGELSTTILQLFGAKSTFAGLWDEQRDQIQALCYQPMDGSPQMVKGSPFLIRIDSSLRSEIEQGKSIVLPVDHDAASPVDLGECLQTEEVQSVVLAPMKTRQIMTGLLGLGMPQPAQEMTRDDMVLIERMALDLANLAEDARLFEIAQAMIASDERNRLARDLHDSVTQVLFSASLVAEVLPQIWRRDPDLALSSLEELRRLTRGALAEMRTMLLELRPSAVIKTPLGELLAQLTEAVTSRSGLPFQIFIEQIPMLPEDVHTSFYRIAQEGLNNVIKHAQASLVTVSLSATPDNTEPGDGWRGEVKLVIKDDGKGFSTPDSTHEHMGMSIIRERAAAINAAVIINSKPGSGTELTLVWHK